MSETPIRVAYLTGSYPRATDTWIQREVASLRQSGVAVDTFSVRKPGEEHLVGASQLTERSQTSYLHPRLRSFATLKLHGRLLASAPLSYARAALLATKTARPDFKGLAYQLAYFVEAGLLASEISNRGIKHLHNHFGDSSATVAMLAAEIGGFSWSFTLHGPQIFFEADQWRLDEKIARAAFCVCISHFCRSQATIFSDSADHDRLHIVHCGVASNQEPPLISQASDRDGQRLIFVARLAEVKGLKVLFDAMVRLRKTYPKLRLTVVGDGPSRSRYETLAAQLGLAESIRFTGYQSQPEVAALLTDADVFVLPSFAEGVPVTLMEAMSVGLPVVSTTVGGVTELVEDGINGFCVAPGDVDGLVNRIDRLLADPNLRTKLGSAGQAKVLHEFSNDTEAARLQTLFQAAIDGHRPTTAAGLRPTPATQP